METTDQPNVITSKVTFQGKMAMKDFYQVMVIIDSLKHIGYFFTKHKRKDLPDFVEFDYELELKQSPNS